MLHPVLDEGQALQQVSHPAGQGLEGGVGLGSPHLRHLGQTQHQHQKNDAAVCLCIMAVWWLGSTDVIGGRWDLNLHDALCLLRSPATPTMPQPSDLEPLSASDGCQHSCCMNTLYVSTSRLSALVRTWLSYRLLATFSRSGLITTMPSRALSVARRLESSTTSSAL